MSKIDVLRALADLSPRLVAAATNQDWDTLTELGNDYLLLVDRFASTSGNGSADEAVEFANLLQRLIADQQMIRDYAGPWLASTRKLLDVWGKNPLTPLPG